PDGKEAGRRGSRSGDRRLVGDQGRHPLSAAGAVCNIEILEAENWPNTPPISAPVLANTASHAAFRQSLIAIPTRTFEFAHEFGNQPAIQCVAKPSADCSNLFASQIQRAASLHQITTTNTVEKQQPNYDQ